MIAALLLALFALPTSPVPCTQEQDEERAAELLAKADFQLEKERYEDAVKTYKLIARKFPDTPAGVIAAKRCAPSTFLYSKLIVDHGPSSNRVDVALMGDGYTLEHQKAFNELADDIPAMFENQKLFDEYFAYFNFRRYNLVSKDAGVDGLGREEDTALGGRVIGTIQGHVGVDYKQVLRMLDEAPEHDGQALVFVRVGTLGTGGGGIAAIGGRNAAVTIHEFGHSFASLGDEYATKTHDRGRVRSRPNVAATEDPEEVPWAHWLEAKARGIGVYEGANGQVRDAWKPVASGCVMEDGNFFCAPCREALVLRIYSLVDPIDWVNLPPVPRDHAASLEVEDELTFEVHVMRPRKHVLEVSWWVFAEEDAPRDPVAGDPRYANARSRLDRSRRGPLWPIVEKPHDHSRVNKTGKHTFTVKARDLEPGRYRVVCRAKDTTKVRGDKLPWVLKDEAGLLESERAWWITVPER